MMHVDVRQVIVMREVTRRREGEEVEGETTRGDKTWPVCLLLTHTARKIWPAAPATRMPRDL